MASATASQKRKNAPGNRSDPGWDYGVPVGEVSEKKVMCKLCEKVYSGGVFRLKHHLAGTNQNVKACEKVTPEVKEKFRQLIQEKFEVSSKRRKIYDVDDDDDDPFFAGGGRFSEKSGTGSCSGSGQIAMDKFVKKAPKQSTINQLYKKEQREIVCQQIARWFYTSALPFNAVKNPDFGLMVEMIGQYGMGLKPPSYHEIRVKYLNMEVKKTMNMLEVFREEWKKTGCSIMSDSWTDGKKRCICNFLVNSPMGTVFLSSVDTSKISKTARAIYEMLLEIVNKVGEENVIQVITDNAANYKAAGAMLMEEKKHLYWTPCAAHCIDLMLEDFEKKINVHRVTIKKGRRICTFIYSRPMVVSWLREFTKGIELIRPAITRFATAYLTLGRLHEQKGALLQMFTSDKWKKSKFASIEKGKRVEKIVLDSRDFWPSVITCLKAATPLIKVLRMVDSDENPSMGFLYEGMNRAKEKIAANFKQVKKSYEPIWEIIDQRWDSQLHKPLHAAALMLNPYFRYSPNFKEVTELKLGFLSCIDRLVESREERHVIDLQMSAFKKAKGLFGNEYAIASRTKKTPADWWEEYGDECPELQRFAVRVLSLTCSSSGCERNWSAFEMVHSKRRNRLHQQRMNDLVFVMYNIKLKARHDKRMSKPEASVLYLDDVPSDDEWITEKENAVLPKKRKWLDVLDRTTRKDSRNGSDMDHETVARDLREACGDEEMGVLESEVHDVSDDEDNDDGIIDMTLVDSDDEEYDREEIDALNDTSDSNVMALD